MHLVFFLFFFVLFFFFSFLHVFRSCCCVQRVLDNPAVRANASDVMFASTISGRNISKLIPAVVNLTGRGEQRPIIVLIAGLPNVGKSSLINALRRHHRIAAQGE
jgi:Fe2+ transport system protein B